MGSKKASIAVKPESAALAVVKPPVAPAVPTEDGLGEIVGADQGQYGAPENNKVIQALLAQHGATAEHVGGSLPPLFPKNVREGGSRVIIPIELEHIGKDESGGNGEFDVLVCDVVDPRSLKIVYRSQQVMSKAFEDFFGTLSEGKSKDIRWGKGIYAITYAGQLEPKDNGRSGMKLWRIDEIKGLTIKG